MTTNALVVGRFRKGRQIDDVVGEVERLLRDGGWKVTSRVVKRKRDLRRLARDGVKEHLDVVVVVGGDGAVLQVASSLAETSTALGIIPAGTGNLLAGNLRIPREPAAAARTLLSGRLRKIDLGRVTVDGVEHDFTVACGIGFDAKVMDATGTSQKIRWGKLAYLANAIGQTGHIHNAPHVITIDGVRTTTEAAQVFIANFGRMLPVVVPRRRIRGDDGLLDVIVVRASGPIPGLLAGWEALMQKDLGESAGGHVFRAQARSVEIESEPSRLVETDGSVVGRTPVGVSIRPGALTVIVPR
ncbi:MAG: diacylglycerol/lipid kinase family protein [Candidatus Limnocylindrales bacterium]